MGGLPRHSNLEPRSQVSLPSPRANPAQAATAGNSGSGGERCGARWAARRPRLGLHEVSQDRIHDIVVDDEGNDAHLPTARRAQHRVHLVGPLDNHGKPAAKGACVLATVPSTLITTGSEMVELPDTGRCDSCRRITTPSEAGDGAQHFGQPILALTGRTGCPFEATEGTFLAAEAPPNIQTPIRPSSPRKIRSEPKESREDPFELTVHRGPCVDPVFRAVAVAEWKHPRGKHQWSSWIGNPTRLPVV